MKEIIEVKQKWPDDYLRIEFSAGDICNFQCWYCAPDLHAAEYKWPDYDTLIVNLSHMLDYYLEHTNKKRFEFCMLGGEITHWPKFLDFMQYFKERYTCIFNLISNGSKKISWWEKAAPYLDYVLISHHQKFADAHHNAKVLDLLYEQGVIGVVTVLMDPTEWDGCLDAVEVYKTSKHRWSIRYGEVIHPTVKYTDEQKALIETVRARRPNIFWFLWNNKTPRLNPKVVDVDYKTTKVSDSYIILNRLNEFYGWECNLGVDWLAIKIDGTVTGTCSNPLYKEAVTYNIYDKDFRSKFTPTIGPSLCVQTKCWCGFDASMPKRKIDFTTKHKVIPIHVN